MTIREYDMVLRGHPSCSYGPLVSLGSLYLECRPLGVNEYEYHHSRRRPKQQLCLNYYHHMEILLRGYSQKDLKEAVKEKDASCSIGRWRIYWNVLMVRLRRDLLIGKLIVPG